MMKFLDIHFNFLCRTTFKNSKGQYPIILRVIYRSQRRDIFTGLYCYKQEWNSKEARLFLTDKKAGETNKNLDLIMRKANDVFDELRFSGVPFSIDELSNKIKGKEQKPQYLMEYMQEVNKKMLKRVGVEITKATYYKYNKSVEYVEEFLTSNNKAKNFLVLRVDKSFIESYFLFLRTKKNNSHNTSLKYLSFLKVLLSPAIHSGIIKNDPFKDLKFKAKPVYRDFLTQEEIILLENLELDNEDLRRKKDIFLFSCYTGLAYTDLKQLEKKHLVREADGSYYIIKPRQKTGQESIIPLLPTAERILTKYSLTGNIQDFKWYISSNQKMNLGLKHIGQKAGIGKTLHMHLARHTFATTVTLANGVPIESVSKMLGHASIRQTQHYAKVVATKIKMDMLRIKDIYK